MTQPDPRIEAAAKALYQHAFAESIADLNVGFVPWFRLDADDPDKVDLTEIATIALAAADLVDRARLALTQIRDLCDQIHGHGADTFQGEMRRLRGILNRIDAAILDAAEGAR